MSDRLSQLQICLDQLLIQFTSMLNYVDSHHDSIPMNGTEDKLVDPKREVDPPEKFHSSIVELSTDLILKTRQILTLIESLPGAGVSQEEQLAKIGKLQNELVELEEKKVGAVQRKEDLLKVVNGLVKEFSEALI